MNENEQANKLLSCWNENEYANEHVNENEDAQLRLKSPEQIKMVACDIHTRILVLYVQGTSWLTRSRTLMMS